MVLGRSAAENNPVPLYTTDWGEAYLGDALALLRLVPDESVDLILTSPPFALARPKAYGNVEEGDYADWFLPFAAQARRVLKKRGSFVLELGWAYLKGRPVRSLYNIKTVLRLCRELDFLLCQEFSWHNPAKLPTPVEWVCKRRIRVKDSVSPLFWLAKVEDPQADWTGVRPPARPTRRGGSGASPLGLSPGEHDLPIILPPGQETLPADPGLVEVPTNLLNIANTDSNSRYLRYCRELGIPAHPARFPLRLPQFFIEGLTEPGNLVMDFMAGANAVGTAAERLGRRWVAFELRLDYLAASALNFLPAGELALAENVYRCLLLPQSSPVHLDSALAGHGGRNDPSIPRSGRPARSRG